MSHWGSGIFVEGDLGRPEATKLAIFGCIDLPVAQLVQVAPLSRYTRIMQSRLLRTKMTSTMTPL